MVVAKRSSVYRHDFRPGAPVEVARSYTSNMDYRQDRRKNECGHSGESFNWQEPINSDASDSESFDSARAASRLGLPKHKYKHDKFNQAYRKYMELAQNSPTVDGESDEEEEYNPTSTCISLPLPSTPKPRPVERGVQTPEWNKPATKAQSKGALVSPKTSGVQVSTAKRPGSSDGKLQTTETSPKHNVSGEDKTEKPRKPGLKVHSFKKLSPKPRPVSAPNGRPVTKKEQASAGETDARPPFAHYGQRDVELETGVKKTHNVRASHDIYPAALRAQRRRQYDLRIREEELQKQRKSVSAQNAQREKLKRDANAWDTEYRHNYIEYNNYACATPHRVVVKRPNDLIASV